MLLCIAAGGIIATAKWQNLTFPHLNAFATPSPTPALTLTAEHYSYSANANGNVLILATVHNPTTTTFGVAQIYFQPWDTDGIKCKMLQPPNVQVHDVSTGYYAWAVPGYTFPPGDSTFQIQCHLYRSVYTHATIGVFLKSNAPRLEVTVTLHGTR